MEMPSKAPGKSFSLVNTIPYGWRLLGRCEIFMQPTSVSPAIRHGPCLLARNAVVPHPLCVSVRYMQLVNLIWNLLAGCQPREHMSPARGCTCQDPPTTEDEPYMQISLLRVWGFCMLWDEKVKSCTESTE